MNSNKKIARIVGVLFITATVTGTISVIFLKPVLGTPDYLINISANANQVIIGALFEFIMAAACAGIAISMYPILKKYNAGLALGSVVARVIESVLYMICVSSLLTLLTLSQEFVKAGAPDASCFQTLGGVLIAGQDWTGHVLGMIAFSIGALMYNYLFYQSKLVPRWLSVWGIVGAALAIAAGLLVMFGHEPFSTTSIFLNLPIGVNEMVLAVWLIVKGFDSSVIASGSAKTNLAR